MTPFSEQQAFTISDLETRGLGSKRKRRRIIAAGQIGFLRIGGSVLVPEEELERFLAERFTPARTAPRTDPQTVVQLLDKMLPRRRGRPRIGGAE